MRKSKGPVDTLRDVADIMLLAECFRERPRREIGDALDLMMLSNPKLLSFIIHELAEIKSEDRALDEAQK